MDVAFGEDTFSAFAVSGSYTQKGKKLSFEVAAERLRAFESSWQAAYGAALRAEGSSQRLLAARSGRPSSRGAPRRAW